MAKSKKVVDDEEIAQESDAEIETDAADSEADADADADVNADADADGDGSDEDGEDAAAEPAKPPKPKLTKLTIALILLNWIAVPAFVVIGLMDHAVRSQYSYRALLNHTQIWGPPLGEETEYPSVSNETRPVMRLTSRQLEEAFKKRPGALAAMGKDFLPVEEPIPVHLTVKEVNLTNEFLEDLYGSGVNKDQRYKTLEAAIDDLRQKLPGQIADAAKLVKEEFAKKKEAEKREFVQKSLFVMTWDSAEAKKMEDQIANATGKDLDDLVKRALVEKILYPIALDYSDEMKDEKGRPIRVWVVDRIDEDLAKAKGAELDALVDEAVQRRIYYDILAPINLYRPGDLKLTDVERIADRGKFKLAEVKDLLDKRLQAAVASQYDTKFNIGKDYEGKERDSIEKRQKIAFILFTLGQVQVPVLDKKLYPKGIERAQTVSGLYEFTNASIAYVQAMRILEQRMESRVAADRDGNTFATSKDGKLLRDEKGNPIMSRTSGIIDHQPAQIDSMQRLVEQVDAAQKRLDEKKLQRDQFNKRHDERVAQLKDVADKLIKARQGTEKYVKELRTLQVQLHEALLELSDAADTNFRLEAEIRALELSYYKTSAQKGGKK